MVGWLNAPTRLDGSPLPSRPAAAGLCRPPLRYGTQLLHYRHRVHDPRVFKYGVVTKAPGCRWPVHDALASSRHSHELAFVSPGDADVGNDLSPLTRISSASKRKWGADKSSSGTVVSYLLRSVRARRLLVLDEALSAVQLERRTVDVAGAYVPVQASTDAALSIVFPLISSVAALVSEFCR